jgi:hypothetical protein
MSQGDVVVLHCTRQSASVLGHKVLIELDNTISVCKTLRLGMWVTRRMVSGLCYFLTFGFCCSYSNFHFRMTHVLIGLERLFMWHYILECLVIIKMLQNCFQAVSVQVQMAVKVLMQFIRGEIPF